MGGGEEGRREGGEGRREGREEGEEGQASNVMTIVLVTTNNDTVCADQREHKQTHTAGAGVI